MRKHKIISNTTRIVCLCLPMFQAIYKKKMDSEKKELKMKMEEN